MPSASTPTDFGPRPSDVALPVALVVIVFVAITLAATLLDGGGTSGRVSNGWIAYAVTPSQRWEPANGIYLVGSGMRAQRIVGSDGDRIRRGCPTFSPDGTKLAYGEGRDKGFLAADRAVVVVSVGPGGSAGSPVRIPVAGAGRVNCPSWSADGRVLAFVPSKGSLEFQELAGDVRVFPVAEADIRDVAWSPVERTLAMARSDGLWILPWDGQPLMVRGGSFDSVRWSPDGDRLAATQLPPDAGGEPAPWPLLFDQGTVRLVWLDGRADDVELKKSTTPSWSKLGDLVVLTSALVDGEVRPVNKIIRPDGSEQLVDQADGLTSGALWSPDGALLLQTMWSVDDQMEVLVVTPAAGGRSVRLAPVPGRGFMQDGSIDDVAWQPIPE